MHETYVNFFSNQNYLYTHIYMKKYTVMFLKTLQFQTASLFNMEIGDLL